jgi:hypothetical protein
VAVMLRMLPGLESRPNWFEPMVVLNLVNVT